MRIDDLAERALAVIVHYGCHPTIMGPPNRLITPDYPGRRPPGRRGRDRRDLPLPPGRGGERPRAGQLRRGPRHLPPPRGDPGARGGQSRARPPERPAPRASRAGDGVRRSAGDLRRRAGGRARRHAPRGDALACGCRSGSTRRSTRSCADARQRAERLAAIRGKADEEELCVAVGLARRAGMLADKARQYAGLAEVETRAPRHPPRRGGAGRLRRGALQRARRPGEGAARRSPTRSSPATRTTISATCRRPRHIRTGATRSTPRRSVPAPGSKSSRRASRSWLPSTRSRGGRFEARHGAPGRRGRRIQRVWSQRNTRAATQPPNTATSVSAAVSSASRGAAWREHRRQTEAEGQEWSDQDPEHAEG